MFNKEKKKITELECELERLQARKKTEEQELKHMIKMKEEKMQLELDQKKYALQAEKDQEVAKVKDEYRDKLEARLIKETENIKGMYSEILERLPNVNASLKGQL